MPPVLVTLNLSFASSLAPPSTRSATFTQPLRRPHCPRLTSPPRRARAPTCSAARDAGRLNGTGPLYAALVGAQLIPFVFPHSGILGDVAYFSTTAVAALILGCVRAQNETELATPMSRGSALAAPFLASAVLFGSYALLKYTQVDIGLVFNALTTFAGALCLKESLDPLCAELLTRLGLQPPDVPVTGSAADVSGKNRDTASPPSSWLATGAAILVTAGYLLHMEPTFVFSNVLAVGIAARALSLVRAESFSVAATLLVLLCLYDLYFVFGSDVMVTVATQIDSPGKLLFPREMADAASGYPYAVLGLGDVCVPGVFVNLAATIGDVTGGPYFKTAIGAYTVGLLSCFGANLVTLAPQPALIYLVPALIGSTLITAAVRKELQLVLQFTCRKGETRSSERKGSGSKDGEL